MFREVMSHNTMVDLPLIALFIFISIFLVVVARVWLKGKNDPINVHLAHLPLEDEDPIAEPHEPTETYDGGDHV